MFSDYRKIRTIGKLERPESQNDRKAGTTGKLELTESRNDQEKKARTTRKAGTTRKSGRTVIISAPIY